MILVRRFLTVGCYLISVALQHNSNGSVLQACTYAFRKQLHRLLGQSRSRDIDILVLQPQYGISDRSTDEYRFMTMLQ